MRHVALAIPFDPIVNSLEYIKEIWPKITAEVMANNRLIISGALSDVMPFLEFFYGGNQGIIEDVLKNFQG